MAVIVCPGIHPRSLTEEFLAQIHFPDSVLVLPTSGISVLSSVEIYQFLQRKLGEPSRAKPLVLIGFSAGVVGAMGAAWGWQLTGGRVRSLIALDGWGVPLGGDFAIHRLSHDHFTHWSSQLLGAGAESFYADPAVDHLELWRSPQTVRGWCVAPPNLPPSPLELTTAAQFLTMLVMRYTESNW